MPIVEWAETSAISRAPQPLRDKPEQSGEVFAAVFDSARRSISERADRTVGEQQRHTIRGDSADVPPSGQAPASDRAANKTTGETGKTGERKHTPVSPSSTERAQQPEAEGPPQSEETEGVEPQAESEDSEKSAPPESPDESSDAAQLAPAENSQPAGELVVHPDPQPVVMPEQGDVRPAEARGEVSNLPEVQRPFMPEALSAPQDAADAMADQAESSAANVVEESVGAAMKVLSSATECQTDGAEENAATVAAPPPETTGSASSEMSPQGADFPALNVWQILRGIAAHLEQVVAPAQKTQRDVVPALAGSKQTASSELAARPGEVAARPAGSQTTAVALAAVLDGQDTGLMHEQAKSSKEQNSGSGAARNSAEPVSPTDAGTQQNAISNEFRGLIDAAGRVRDRIASPDPQPQTGLVGRALDGKGVNLGEARAINDLADVVRANIGPRNSSMLLRLDPPELGQLRIDVRMQGQELVLRLQADTLEGHDALRSRLQELRSSLEQHGFKLSQLDVELRVPQSPSAEPHQDRWSQQHGHWDGQAWNESGRQGETHGGTDTSADPESSNGNSAFSQEDASKGEGHDERGRLAETGVDLVV